MLGQRGKSQSDNAQVAPFNPLQMPNQKSNPKHKPPPSKSQLVAGRKSQQKNIKQKSAAKPPIHPNRNLFLEKL